MKRLPVVTLAGPTASGKSALAMALADALGGVIVNADSMQVYRELRILTARPSEADEARVPHRLYGVRPAAEPWSAGRWCERALAEIDAIHAAGRLPIVVGGSGLYLEALLLGLAPIPPVPAEIRTRAAALHAELGAAAFHERLAVRDPETAAMLDPGNTQRLIRGWELLEATGRGLAAWQREPRTAPPHRFYRLALLPPRDGLYARADARFRAMIEAGALAEAAAWRALALPPSLPAGRALGLAPLIAHLEGRCGLEEAVATAQRDTRHYIKRQTTWLRHRYSGDFVMDEKFSETSAVKILPNISRFLLTLR